MLIAGIQILTVYAANLQVGVQIAMVKQNVGPSSGLGKVPHVQEKDNPLVGGMNTYSCNLYITRNQPLFPVNANQSGI